MPHYAKVKYEEVYPGIDLIYYGKQRQLAYDFVVKPGVDPSQIRLSFQGIDKPALDEHGNLLLEAGGQEFHFQKPFIYQVVNGSRQSIGGDYRVSEDLVGFRVDAYDDSYPLVIDPVLSYSSYIGGSDDDAGASIAVGSDGSVYVTGSTGSINFPTANPLQPTFVGGGPFHSDGFVLKLNAQGTALAYTTYFGGATTISAWASQ